MLYIPFQNSKKTKEIELMENKIKILLAEDDINLGSLLKQYLIAKNYDAELFPDGVAAGKAFVKKQYDLCIFDVMMPKKDGFTLAKEIRAINSTIPIIFLTAKSMKEDVHEGFNIGGDDYITKPFNMQELQLRIQAILRRVKKSKPEKEQKVFTLGQLTFDSHKQLLIKNNKEIRLTTKESELLKMLCINMNEVMERNHALKVIWEDDNYFNARSMDVYITKLRKHLKDEPAVEIINIHGKGYKLVQM